MQLAQPGPLLFDGAFERLESMGRVLVQPLFGRRERRHALLQLLDGALLPMAGGTPLVDDVTALSCQLCESFLGRPEMILLLSPVLHRDRQAFELRLQIGKTLVETRGVVRHRLPERHDTQW